MSQKVSIAMTTYNGAEFLMNQLSSFAAQSRLPDELIIMDDGSTDATRSIVETFAPTAPFPILFDINPERLGYSLNFERAIGRCSGDVIFLSDQDDVWFVDKLAIVMAAFGNNHNVQVVVNDQLMTDRDLNHQGVTKLQNLRRLGVTSDGLIEGCCTAFRQEFGRLLFPFPKEAEPFVERGDLSHDRWINELAIALRVRLVISQPLQYFRRYGSNTTNWFVSNPRRVGIRDLIDRRLVRAPVSAWLKRADLLECYSDWLLTNRTMFERHGVYNVTHALDCFARESASAKSRASLVQMPAYQRSAAILKLFASGGYGYFYGWKSAVRDLFRSG